MPRGRAGARRQPSSTSAAAPDAHCRRCGSRGPQRGRHRNRLTPQMLAVARVRAEASRARHWSSTKPAPSLARRQSDAVFAAGSSCTCPTRRGLLELARVTRPGGKARPVSPFGRAALAAATAARSPRRTPRRKPAAPGHANAPAGTHHLRDRPTASGHRHPPVTLSPTGVPSMVSRTVGAAVC